MTISIISTAKITSRILFMFLQTEKKHADKTAFNLANSIFSTNK